MFSKIASRGITLGTLLDFYDKNKDRTTTATAAQTITPTANHSPVASPAAAPQLSSSHNSGEVESPIIVKGNKDPLSNFYCFNLTIDNVRYRSLEHAFQSMKAKMLGMHYLASKIRFSHSPQVAKRLAKNIPHIATSRLCKLMKYLLRKKSEQCCSFRKALRRTSSSTIFHSTYRDADLWWCTGLDHRDIDRHRKDEYPGVNYLGKMLEELRGEIGPESSYEVDVNVQIVDGYAVVLYDGEQLEFQRPVFRSWGRR
jgi:ribA/ribD-fused uncharacterized protein